MESEYRPAVWGFYPGRHDVAGEFGLTDVFVKQEVIGIGWPLTGDLTDLLGRRDALTKILQRVRTGYRNEPDVQTWNLTKQETWYRRSSGIIYRFVCEAKVGDTVLYASKLDESVHVGTIRASSDGQYLYDATNGDARLHKHFRHFRAVDWNVSIPYHRCTAQELAQLRTQNTFWRITACPDKFLVAREHAPQSNPMVAATKTRRSQRPESKGCLSVFVFGSGALGVLLTILAK